MVDYGPGVAPPVSGRSALRALFGGAAQGFLATSHHNANVLVTFESADRATVLTSVYAWHQAPRGATPQIWGCYHDVAVRSSGGWRLAERQLRVAGNEQWPGRGTRFGQAVAHDRVRPTAAAERRHPDAPGGRGPAGRPRRVLGRRVA